MGQVLEMFLDNVRSGQPPSTGGPLLKAVWHGLRGEWDAAHAIAQDDGSTQGSWVHAWLHRTEGDLPNAAYWYRRARRSVATNDPAAEGQEIARALLHDGTADEA